MYNTTLIKQQYTSAKTSINQIPRLIKTIDWSQYNTHMDIGSGKYYYNIIDYTRPFQTETLVYDPYNIAESINKYHLSTAIMNKVACVTCCNVLNVIKERDIRKQIYQLAKDVLADNGILYIGVYEGDKSGIGRETLANSWQNNQKLMYYLDEVKEIFPNAIIKKGFIISK